MKTNLPLTFLIQMKKTLYNTDNKISASDWIRKKLKNINLIECIQLSSFNTPKQSHGNKIVINHLGYLLIKSNNIESNAMCVGLFSSATSNRGGVSLDADNFIDGLSLFAARKSIKGNCLNIKDEYLAPNEEHPLFEQFKYDSLVYSLFNNSSQQSSLRQVKYKDKLWDIKNEFLWI